MEIASCFHCGSRSFPVRRSPLQYSFSSSVPSICLVVKRNSSTSGSTSIRQNRFFCRNSGTKSVPTTTVTKKKRVSSGRVVNKSRFQKRETSSGNRAGVEKKSETVNVRGLHQNGDPLGKKDLGKNVVRWLSQGMRAMAIDFASSEVEGEFSELTQRMGPGLTFVIQAQPYLSASPMPLGLEAVCLKASTHYPTLFDHFQRELRDVLQQLQVKSVVQDWQETLSWKLLKQLANSGIFCCFLYLDHAKYLRYMVTS